MVLTPGTKLGPYEVLCSAGAGGMGEVYRCRDTRLDRTVAIKVLPQHLSSDAEFKQRFEREARAISQLQHAHVCVLHDVGSHNGTNYLVMEYLEGETVAERLRKGALPLDQLLKIGIEIADALDKAHRLGIIHRDLKPANIMLTNNGAKLTDFGLARALAAPTSAAASAQSGMPNFTATPTRTNPVSRLTSAGTVVGTLNYMSPEQIEGKEADARSDIFAFGAVLYEMATGKRAFEGKSHISVASAILEEEPESIIAAQPTSPRALDSMICACLAKDPEQRFACAHDLKLQLQQIPTQPGEVPTEKSSRWMQYASAFLVVVLALLCGWLAYSRLELLRAPHPVLHAQVNLAGAAFGPAIARGVFAISPDGRYVGYIGRSESSTRIWLKDLSSEADGQPIAGTENASSLFWSPEGRYM